MGVPIWTDTGLFIGEAENNEVLLLDPVIEEKIIREFDELKERLLSDRTVRPKIDVLGIEDKNKENKGEPL